MNTHENDAKNILPIDTLEVFIESWKLSFPEENHNLIEEQNNLKLVDRDGWQALNSGDLIALCRRWKQQFLKNRPDKNAGSLEWLICILRHNATNYDRILEATCKRHAWAAGFGSMLRLKADYLIVSFLRERDLYAELTRKCHAEWMWQNC